LHKLAAEYSVPVATAQVVQCGDAAAQLAQAFAHVTADVASTSDDQHFHLERTIVIKL
jgi:hypothetical protein